VRAAARKKRGVGDRRPFAGDAGERDVAAKVRRRHGNSAQCIGKAQRIELREMGEDDAAVGEVVEDGIANVAMLDAQAPRENTDLAGEQPRRRLGSDQFAQGRHILVARRGLAVRGQHHAPDARGKALEIRDVH